MGDVAEHFLIERDLIAAAVVIAVLGVAGEVVVQLALLRDARRELRGGGAA
jgi:hypothetical protein